MLLLIFIGGSSLHAKVHMELDFDLVDGRMLISGSVEGQEGVYIFDTGSSGIILNTNNVDRSDEELSTIYGVHEAELRDVRELGISGYVLNDLKSVLHMNLSELVADVDQSILGVIGWSVFDNEQPMFIDYAKGKLIIGKPDISTDIIGHNHVIRLDLEEVGDDLPTVQIEVNNEKLTFAFDTGAPLHVMSLDNTPPVKGQLFQENLKLNKYITVKESLFRSENLTAFNEIDGILSVNSLNTDYVLIDRKGKRIFLFWKKEQSL